MASHKILSNYLVLKNISKYLNTKETDMIKFVFKDFQNVELFLHSKVCKNYYCFCSHILVKNIAWYEQQQKKSKKPQPKSKKNYENANNGHFTVATKKYYFAINI